MKDEEKASYTANRLKYLEARAQGLPKAKCTVPKLKVADEWLVIYIYL